MLWQHDFFLVFHLSSQSYAIPVRRGKLDEAAGSFERTLVNSRAANRKLRVRKLLAFLCVEVTPGSSPITYYQFDFGFGFVCSVPQQL